MKLKQIRKKKKITQQEIAKLLNITQQQVSRIENGLSDLSSKQIITLCKFLNVSADELLGLEPIDKQVNKILNLYNTNLSKKEIIEAKKTLDKIAKYVDNLLKDN